MQPIVSKITTFVREPTWVSPPIGMEQHIYSEEEKREFAEKPETLRNLRKATETRLSQTFAIFLKDTQIQNEAKAGMEYLMKEKLQSQFLQEKLIPQWGVGCRRLTPGTGYLEALNLDNVKVVYGEIDRITETGCRCDDGNDYPVDILICATGFDTSFRPRFPVIGLNNTNLQDTWTKEPKAYLGLAAPGCPNYMFFLGPNCPIGNGPLVSAIECQADYMLTLIDRWQTENIHSFTPKIDAVEEFNAHIDQFMPQTIWREDCRSWYKNNSASGRVTALWPGSTLHYIEALGQTRYDDWDVGVPSSQS